MIQKSRVSVTLDKDLIEFAKDYAQYQRTTLSDIFTQFLLNLKRVREKEPTDIILLDPDFKESMMETIAGIRNGEVKWYSYDEVF